MPEIFNDVVREYAEAGFRCVPCDGKNPGIAGPGWQIHASTAPEWLDKWWPEDGESPHNVGILTGDGFVVVDIDPRSGGDETWARLVAANGEAVATVESKTGGFGRHLYFRHHGPVVGSLGPGVDVKATGGQVVEYPSVHPETGNQYEWVTGKDPRDATICDAPGWLADLLTKRDTAPSTHGRQTWQPWHDWSDEEGEQVADALMAIPSDISYPQWVEIGMALHSSGASQAFGLWDAWSQRGDKYTPGETARKWRSFSDNGRVTLATMFWHAEAHGHTIAPGALPEPTASELAGLDTPPSLIDWMPDAPQAMPEHLLNVPGLVGDIANAIESSAAYSQPALSLAASLTAMSVLASRQYKTATHAGLNLMVAGISGTGTGKDHGRTCVLKMLTMTDCLSHIGGDDIASSAAIISELQQHPVKLFRKDEFGEWVKKISGRNAPPHLADIKGTINEIFTSSLSDYTGRAKASSETKREPIKHPHLIIYATGTPESTFSAMSGSDSENGFLNRFAMFWGNRDRGKRNRKARSFYLAQETIGTLREIAGKSADPTDFGSLMDVGDLIGAEPEEKQVAMTADADDVFSRVEDVSNVELARGNYIWARAELLAIKLASLAAIGVNHLEPVVDADLARWGAELSIYLTDRFAQEFRSRQSGSAHHAILNDMRRIIYDQGGSATKTDFARKLQKYSSRERAEAIKTLVEGGFVTMEGAGTKGRKTTIFKAMSKKGKNTQKQLAPK